MCHLKTKILNFVLVTISIQMLTMVTIQSVNQAEKHYLGPNLAIVSYTSKVSKLSIFIIELSYTSPLNVTVSPEVNFESLWPQNFAIKQILSTWTLVLTKLFCACKRIWNLFDCIRLLLTTKTKTKFEGASHKIRQFPCLRNFLCIKTYW